MPVQRYFIEMAYLGTHYNGWQTQPNAITVQEELEKALTTLLKEEVKVTGAGRTDTGVHARFFVSHFDSELDGLNRDYDFLYSLNEVLPRDITVKEIVAVTPDAHARFSALSRTYQYIIARTKDPFTIQTAWHYKGALDIERMKLATDYLSNYTDFSSFCKAGSDVKTFDCKVFAAYWEARDNYMFFTIRADRFLRNMVRAIVGTLVEVGRGRIEANEFVRIIEAKDRGEAGMSAPAEGLFLTNIEYPTKIFIDKPSTRKKRLNITP